MKAINYIMVITLLTMITSIGHAQKKDKCNEQLEHLNKKLEQEQANSKSEREHVDILLYQLSAKKMALRYLELTDSISRALTVIQAYKFNLNNEGNTSDIEIYQALMGVAQQFNIPVDTTFSSSFHDTHNKNISSQMAILAGNLCSIMERNMTLDEWNYFTPFLPYETTCIENK